MSSERGALVGGSDPPSGHRVHATAGDTWQAPDTKLLATGEENTPKQLSIPLRWQKRPFFLFSRSGEERRTPRATSRLIDHGSI